MRETNFRSIPLNRASVSITTTLYDRRALDCTADRPLIYSLNNLVFLVSSSARIRESLTTDGGIERLASILKECQYDEKKTKDLTPTQVEDLKVLYAWKWLLAFQSLVFISTRGSEEIRRRVVSCGIIPIIATVLQNYFDLSNHSKPQRCKYF